MICKNCYEGVVVEGGGCDYVTLDMAIDAGDRSLVGRPMYREPDYYPCQCCEGSWQDCPRCKELEGKKQ